MSIQRMKKDINGLKEAINEKPLRVLLNCNAEDLTDDELERVLREVPVMELPSEYLLESIERKCDAFLKPGERTRFRSIDDIPEEYIEKMKENLRHVSSAD